MNEKTSGKGVDRWEVLLVCVPWQSSIPASTPVPNHDPKEVPI